MADCLAQGVKVSESGLVVGSVFVTTIICTPIAGKFVETLGARRFLIIGTALVGLGNGLFGFLAELDNRLALNNWQELS